MSPSWKTTADWDAAQSETGTHHEQPTGTDWAPADKIEPGLTATQIAGRTPYIHFPLNDSSGPVQDVSGNNRDGTVNGATLDANGVGGFSAASFDGVDDDIRYSNNSTSAFSNGVTVGGWFYLQGSDSREVGLSLGDGGFTDVIERLMPRYFGTIGFRYNSGGTATTISGGSASLNAWKLIVGSIDSGGSMALFTDNGDQIASGSCTYDGLAGGTLKVGKEGNNNNPYQGRAQDVFVLTGPTTAAEVSDIYQAYGGTSTYVSSKKQL